LSGKVALITGATSGIGAETARQFVAAGAEVVISGRRAGRGRALAAELGPAALFVAADVTDEEQVAALVAAALDRHGRIDALVNAAGAPSRVTPLIEVDTAAFRDTLELNLVGPLHLIKLTAPSMIERGSGSVVNVASVAGHLAAHSSLGYSAAKAGLQHLTRWAAMELGEKGIRVNTVSPGYIATGVFGKTAGMDEEQAEERGARLVERLGPSLVDVQPLARAGTPAEVAGVAVWLASDASAYVTGQNIAVDGGMSVGQPFSALQKQRTAIARIITADN
jgi:NAD(P)-dependent dehydrogenase (short-subunit alcohol dehydrogenase family)